jgi:ribose 5-phosphate isomerase B
MRNKMRHGVKKVTIGADHRGFLQKEYIKNNISDIEWIDVGTHSEERTDYPIFSDKVVELIQEGSVDYGVLLCGTGGGMAIAANRYKNMYAVVAWNKEIASRAKQEDNANILVIPSDFVSDVDAIIMIKEWLAQEFKGGRYAQRIKMIDK